MHVYCNVQFNFVGKILGPKGNSLKRIQEDTGTRMAVFGRGSMRDKQKVCVATPLMFSYTSDELIVFHFAMNRLT